MRGVWWKWAVCGGLVTSLLGCTGSVTGTAGGSGGATGEGGAADGGAGGHGLVDLLLHHGSYMADATFNFYVGDCAPITKTIGECSYWEQDASCPPTDSDAGTVTIQTPTATTSLTAAMPSTSGSTPLFQPGETVEVSSTGAAVPAFAGSVVVPPAITLTSTSLGGSTLLNTAEDLVLTWPATTGHVVVFLASGDTAHRALSCTFDGAAGTGTMPSAALAAFPEKDASLVVYSIESTSLTAGDWPIHLTAQIQATDPQGNWMEVQVTLQ